MTNEKVILEAIHKLDKDFAVRSGIDAERHETNQKNINALFEMSRSIEDKILCGVIHETVHANSRSIKWMLGLVAAVFVALISLR